MLAEPRGFLRRLLSFSCFLWMHSCGGAQLRPPEEPLLQRVQETGTLSATYPSTPTSKLTWTGASPPLFEVESASAVIPPGVDLVHCPGGRVFMGHGRSDAVAGVARRVDSLSLLDHPQASVLPGPVGAASVPAGDQIVDEYPAMPADTIPVGEKICLDGSCFCEFTGTVPRYLRGATDTFTVRAGPATVLQMVAAMGYRMGDVASGCQPVPFRAVNILRRSTDCGRSWTTSVLNAGGFEDTFYSNADLPFLYVDRNEPRRIFVAGGSGPPLGGVRGLLVWRSDDNGRTWTPRFSPKVNGRPVLLSSHAMTTTSEGTVVLAGCGVSTSESNDAPLLVYYSLNHGDDWSGPVAQPTSVSNCGFVRPRPSEANSNHMPGNLHRIPGTFLSVSRVKPSGSTRRSTVRIVYSAREKDSRGVDPSQRQVAKLVEVTIPGQGARGNASLSPIDTLRPSGPDDSIFLASYIETDAFGPPTESDKALLWWLEGRRSKNPAEDGMYSVRYLIQSGHWTFSPTHPLATRPDGSELRWRYNGPCSTSGCWLGEYERGAFWYDTPGNKLRFLVPWPGRDPDVSGTHAFYYFNEVQVTP